MKMNTTTFIIPSIDRPTLQRAIRSVGNNDYLVKIDKEKIGEAAIRNELIRLAKTEWVSFLDDDDTITSDYVARLQEEIKVNPEADVIHFREYFLRGQLLPTWPKVEWGNIGISFSVKRQVAIDNPFLDEDHEDYHFVRRLEEKRYKIHFSKYLTYHVRH